MDLFYIVQIVLEINIVHDIDNLFDEFKNKERYVYFFMLWILCSYDITWNVYHTTLLCITWLKILHPIKVVMSVL